MSSEAVVPYIVQKLGDLLIQETQLLCGVNEEVKYIKKELEWMQCFLKDADSKQNKDELVKKWVSDIRDVSYEIEDVIETCIYSQRKREGLVGRVQRGISEPKNRHKVGKQIEQIKEKISDISRRRLDYGIRDINEGRQEASTSRQRLEEDRRRFALLEEPEVVGQQEEISTLKRQLINGEQRHCVISIVGMGGLGKTTLARKVYHDVKNDFDCHAFICLSQQYEMKDVLIRVITCIMDDYEEIEFLRVDELGRMLRDHLKQKKYLVVIDDIWSIKAWDDLKLVLPANGKHQSRVMLTTRIRDVAKHADPKSPLHEMRLLNDNEGWELFMKKVFPGENPLAACPLALEEIGREIFNKCGGLPLAILVIGGLLARKDKAFHAWHNFLQSVSPHLTEGSEQYCMEILALSYWDLPYHLKPCFLYLGLFPEDYEISSDMLIRLWIAEGFIESKLMEDDAERYLEELVSRSMIQVVARKSNGLVDKCCLHDLLRDLSISEARQNNFFTISEDNGTSSSSTSVRRLAFHDNVDGVETSNISTESLRSILYFPNSKVPLLKLLDTRPELLRVLKIDSVDLSEVTLDQEIGVSAHLRYLEIGVFAHLRYLEIAYYPDYDGRHRFMIPPSIGVLSYLQTLYIRLLRRTGSTPCFYLTLPNEISNEIFNLKQLRHLQASSFVVGGHQRLENLINLCTLCLDVGSWMEDGLDKLTNLRELKIAGDMSSYQAKIVCDSIDKLHNLQVLELAFKDSSPTWKSFTRHSHLHEMCLIGRIQKLPEFPPNLAKLTLLSSRLQEDAISTLEKLSNLKILHLNYGAYIGEKMICSSGGFPGLELLRLEHLSIKELIVEEGAMPLIKSVELHWLSYLSKTTLPGRVCDLVKRSRE